VAFNHRHGSGVLLLGVPKFANRRLSDLYPRFRGHGRSFSIHLLVLWTRKERELSPDWILAVLVSFAWAASNPKAFKNFTPRNRGNKKTKNRLTREGAWVKIEFNFPWGEIQSDEDRPTGRKKDAGQKA